MKEYLVSLDIITSSSVTDSQLAELLGLSRSLLAQRETKRGRLWRLISDVDQKVPFEKHIETLLTMIPTNLVIGSDSVISRIYLSIGILYDSATCSIRLTKEQLHFLVSKCPDLDIEITCYPCEKDEEDEEQKAYCSIATGGIS